MEDNSAEDSSALEQAKQILKEHAAIYASEAPEAVFDLDALIQDARTRLAVAPAKVVKAALEAPDADLVNSLLAQADQFKRAADAATKERDKITAFLKELIEANEPEPGAVEELTVHGATVFTYKTVVSRVLNQAHLKSVFPDIPENAEAWKDQSARRADYK